MIQLELIISYREKDRKERFAYYKGYISLYDEFKPIYQTETGLDISLDILERLR